MALTITRRGAAGPARQVPGTRPGAGTPLRYAPAPQPTAATAIGLLYCFGGTGALLGARFPMSPHLAIGLSQFLGVASLAIAVPLFALRRRLGPVTLNAALVLAVVSTSALVASTGSAVGVVVPGVFYLCGALVAAYFFAPAPARAQAGLAVGGFSAGVIASGVPHLFVPWLVVVVATVGGAELLRNVVAQLHRLAVLDPLTGLANRAYFQLAAERELALARRGQARFSVALLDLDHFKAVNDTYGHGAGDTLLTELAAAWQAQLRRADLLARYGGDEFALVMPGTGPDEAARVLDRLRAAHHAPWSAGVVTWDGESELSQLLQRADRDLYQAKDARPR